MKCRTRAHRWLRTRLDFGIDGSDMAGRTRSPIAELLITTSEKVLAKSDDHQNRKNRHGHDDADEQGDGESSGSAVGDDTGIHSKGIESNIQRVWWAEV